MSVSFASPSYRASTSDLTVAISPLGLVELADEEFEVHGPRLNRYAHNMAWYLGHHWGYRREIGEPQLTFNYIRAFQDFITNFCFGKGIWFSSPEATNAIVPSLLKRIWEEDNKKDAVLWEIGTLGGVLGDVFVKIAYEEPWLDPAGFAHEGRVRIIPINPSFAFPEYHPHDRDRLVRFKLKYRFWGVTPEGTRQVFCVDDTTEALTREGWKFRKDLSTEEDIFTINPVTKVAEWQPVQSVHSFDYEGPMIHWRNSHGFDALTTPNHRWLVAHRDRNGNSDFDSPAQFKVTEDLSGGNRQIITGGGIPMGFATTPVYSNEFVELVGWAVTEGHYQKGKTCGVLIGQSETANPEKCERIRRLVKHFSEQGATATNQNSNRSGKYAGCKDFYFGKGIGNLIRLAAPEKRLTPEFLGSLTLFQAGLLYETLLDGDGHRAVVQKDDGYNRVVSTENFIQKSGPLVDDYQMLAAMLGKRTCAKPHSSHPGMVNVTTYSRSLTTARHLQDDREDYQGIVWCPKTKNQTWLARRNGGTFWTGNTYVELLTPERVQEFVNDEMIRDDPNPMGEIPIVPIRNIPIPSSPWGLADIADIIPLNRELNEKSTDISDIINYHASPITVLLGARAQNLEKSAKKVWSLMSKDADVKQLSLDPAGIGQALEFFDRLLNAMHDMTGVPAGALGQTQPISNTSGVALAIQYQSLMNRRSLKITQYGEAVREVNRIALKQLYLKEPRTQIWDPSMDTTLADYSLRKLDRYDPISYKNTVNWQPPLPVDKLVQLNEIQAKMALGLESKIGALRDLGEEFPEDKLEELMKELIGDTEDQLALQYLKALAHAIIMAKTGVIPEGAEPVPPAPAEDGDSGSSSGAGGSPSVSSAGGPGVNTALGASSTGILPGIVPTDMKDAAKMFESIQQRVAGTKLAQRRVPGSDEED